MLRYIAGRVAQAVLVLWAAYTVSFLVLYELPSDPVAILLGGGTNAAAASPAQIAHVKHEFGLDRPVIVQYFHQLWQVLHFNFGTSIAQAGRPVIWSTQERGGGGGVSMAEGWGLQNAKASRYCDIVPCWENLVRLFSPTWYQTLSVSSDRFWD